MQAMDNAKPRPPLTHQRVNAQGLIEVIDLHTGRILCIQREPHEQFLQNKFDNLIKINTAQGPVWIERGIDPGRVLFREQAAYAPGWADLLTNHMLEQTKIGKSSSLSHACQAIGLPYALVCRWRREFPLFRETLELARKDRAELLADEALDHARTATADTAKETSIKVATLQWEAERADHDRFGTKKKVDVDHKGSVTFMLDTGIRRAGDQGYKAVELKDVGPESLGENEQKAIGPSPEQDIFVPPSHSAPEGRQEVQPLPEIATPVHVGEASSVEHLENLPALRTFD